MKRNYFIKSYLYLLKIIGYDTALIQGVILQAIHYQVSDIYFILIYRLYLFYWYGIIILVCIICIRVFMQVCICIVGTPFYFTPYMDSYRVLCFLIPLLSVLYRHVLYRCCVFKRFRIILGDLCILPNIISLPWGRVPNIVRWFPLVHLILFGGIYSNPFMINDRQRFLIGGLIHMFINWICPLYRGLYRVLRVCVA